PVEIVGDRIDAQPLEGVGTDVATHLYVDKRNPATDRRASRVRIAAGKDAGRRPDKEIVVEGELCAIRIDRMGFGPWPQHQTDLGVEHGAVGAPGKLEFLRRRVRSSNQRGPIAMQPHLAEVDMSRMLGSERVSKIGDLNQISERLLPNSVAHLA